MFNLFSPIKETDKWLFMYIISQPYFIINIGRNPLKVNKKLTSSYVSCELVVKGIDCTFVTLVFCDHINLDLV